MVGRHDIGQVCFLFSNFFANLPAVRLSLAISPLAIVLLGVEIKLWFFGRYPNIRYAHNPDLDECQVGRLPRVQIWFQHLTIDQCKVWCILNHGYTTSPVTGPSVARFHVNGGHPQTHTPRFSDIERVEYLDVCYFIYSCVIKVAYVRIDISIHRLLDALDPQEKQARNYEQSEHHRRLRRTHSKSSIL